MEHCCFRETDWNIIDDVTSLYTWGQEMRYILKRIMLVILKRRTF